MESKTPSQSRTTQTEIVLPNATNNLNNLMGGRLMHWMDIIMLGYFTNSTMAGLYHPAARTAGLLQAILLSFMSIYTPIMSQLHGQGNILEMSNLYKLVSRWLITFSIPI